MKSFEFKEGRGVLTSGILVEFEDHRYITFMFFLHADVSSSCAIGVRVRMNDRRNTMTITNITLRVM